MCAYIILVFCLYINHMAVSNPSVMFDQNIILSINIHQSICKIFCHHTAAVGTCHHLKPATTETSPQGVNLL